MKFKYNVSLVGSAGISLIAQHRLAVAWCITTFGTFGDARRWHTLQSAYGEFRFRSKKDAVLFTLRWQ